MDTILAKLSSCVALGSVSGLQLAYQSNGMRLL